jgi:acetyl-CoA carboxylase alpha subunit
MKITAADLLGLEIVDAIVPEPSGGAVADPDLAAALLKTAIRAAFDEWGAIKRDRLVQLRCERYRSIGRRYAVKAPLPADRLEAREQGTAPAAAEASAG